jgi:Flp pilus assembly protein TadD
LLLDALRQAEQQKQQGKEFTLPDLGQSSALALEPHVGSGTPLPELPARLEDLDDQFVAAGAAPKKAGYASATISGTDAPRPLAGDSPVRDRLSSPVREAATAPAVGYPFVVIAGIAGLVALVGVGGYVFWQMPAQSGLMPSAPPAASALHPFPVHSDPPQPSSALPDLPPPPAPLPVARIPALEPRPAALTVAPPAVPEPLPQPDKPPEIRFRRGAQSAAPTAGIADTAHAAFMQGEIVLARTLWQRALRTDPFDPNALHGLAAVALREGRAEDAAALYRRALEADPHDAVAFAGWLPLQGAGDPRLAEARLKRLLAEQADAPHLNFALANLYASEARWVEAQQAYFKAHVADPGNPDFLYNLAVSLDHLHQPGLAEQFYARAQNAAKIRPSAFDPAMIAARLRDAPAGSAHGSAQ